MGWESALSLVTSGVGALNTTNTAIAQTQGIAATADYQAQNIANRTSRNIGSLETSFIKGGIALDGLGGTNAVFQQAGAQGQTDIQRTIDNANNQISNTLSEARTKALTGIAGGIAKLGAGSINGAVAQAWNGSALQSAWNGLTGNVDPSPQGNGTAFIDTSSLSSGSYGSGDWRLS